MLRKFAVSAYVACLIVLGIAIGDSLVPTRKAEASYVTICYPYSGSLSTIPGTRSTTIVSTTNCPAGGRECDYFLVYQLWLWDNSTQLFHSIGTWDVPHAGSCGTTNYAYDNVSMWSGRFALDAWIYQGDPYDPGPLLDHIERFYTFP